MGGHDIPMIRCIYAACQELTEYVLSCAGADMKLVVNMIMGSMMVAFAEGLSLADKVWPHTHVF